VDLGQFSVDVDYGPLPDIWLLKREYPGMDNVSGIFDGRQFQEHAARNNANKKSGERTMIAKCFGEEIESEAAIERMFPFGWIPVGDKGAYYFARANPDLLELYWFIALGAIAIGAGNRLVAALSGGPGWRTLGSRSFDNRWDPQKLFLFERR